MAQQLFPFAGDTPLEPQRQLLEVIRPLLEADVEGPGKKFHDEQRSLMLEALERIEENTRKTAVGVETPAGLAPIGADE